MVSVGFVSVSRFWRDKIVIDHVCRKGHCCNAESREGVPIRFSTVSCLVHTRLLAVLWRYMKGSEQDG